MAAITIGISLLLINVFFSKINTVIGGLLVALIGLIRKNLAEKEEIIAKFSL